MNTVAIGSLRQALSEEQLKLDAIHRNRKHFQKVLDTIYKEVEESERKIHEIQNGIDILIEHTT